MTAAVHHSRGRSFGADTDPSEGVRDIHDTEFFEMSLKMSTVSSLDVSSDYETRARADGVFVLQFSEGAGERERNSVSLVLDAWSEVFLFFLKRFTSRWSDVVDSAHCCSPSCANHVWDLSLLVHFRYERCTVAHNTLTTM